MFNHEILRQLKNAVGDGKVQTGIAERYAYSYDSQPEKGLSDVVVHAELTADVVAVLEIAAKYGIPVVARGAGSGMTGGSVPESGGIILNFERMNRIIRIDAEDRIGYCEPGVVTAEFQRAAARFGLFYPPEPASAQFSSLGGNVAESAGGLTTVKYGLTKHYTAGLGSSPRWFGRPHRSLHRREHAFDVGSLMLGSRACWALSPRSRSGSCPSPRTHTTAFYGTLVDTVGRPTRSGRPARNLGPRIHGQKLHRYRTGVCRGGVPDGRARCCSWKSRFAEDVDEAARVVEATSPLSIGRDQERIRRPRTRGALEASQVNLPGHRANRPAQVQRGHLRPISKIPDICRFVEELGPPRLKVCRSGIPATATHINL